MLIAKNVMLTSESFYTSKIEEMSGERLTETVASLLKSNFESNTGVVFYTSNLDIIPVKRRSSNCKILTISTGLREKETNTLITVLFVRDKTDFLKSMSVCNETDLKIQLTEISSKMHIDTIKSLKENKLVIAAHSNDFSNFTNPVLESSIKVEVKQEQPVLEIPVKVTEHVNKIEGKQEQPVDEDFYLGDSDACEKPEPFHAVSTVSKVDRVFLPSWSNVVNSFIEYQMLNVLSTRIILPAKWSSKEWFGSYTLKMYVMSVEFRVQLELSKSSESTSGTFLVDKKSNSVVYNTGLLTKTGDHVLIIAEINGVGLLRRRICERVEFVRLFGKDVSIKPVRLYNHKSELVFSGEFDSFDFSDWDQMLHCVQDRRGRFPDKYKDFTDDALALDIVNAVRYSLMLQSNDFTYIKPFFAIRENTVGYLVPYHIANNVKEPCELFLVALRKGDYWKIMTVLSVEQAGNNISFFTPYAGM